MAVIALHVPGMTCRRCVRIVTARLRDLPGVILVESNAVAEEVIVHGDVSGDQVRAALADVTFPANGTGDDKETASG
jgi:copper chaperone CopZ